jgi:Tfp pilus assembly protein PilN
MQVLDLPGQVPANVRQFVEQELRQYVVLSGRDMLFDFCGIGGGPGLPKRLLAVGTDAGHVREIIRACRSAGLSVARVEPAALACAAAIRRGEGQADPRGDLLLGQLDGGCLTVCQFRRGNLELVRVREAPADAGTAESFSQWLAAELRAALMYGDGEIRRDHGPQRITVLVQDLAFSAPEMQRCLATEAQMEQATVVDARAGGYWPGGVEPKEDAAPQGVSPAAFGAAAGLLDRQAGDLRVNLLPEEVTRARLAWRRLLVAANVAAWVFLALLVLVQFVARTTGAKRTRIEETRISRQLHATPALLAQERFVADEIAHIRRDLERLDTVRSRQRVNWPDVLHAARRAVPATVGLEQLASPDGRSLVLKGRAPSCEAAEQFIRNLDGGGFVEYQIECSLKPVP